MKALIEEYAVTTDGKPVVRGLYRFYETTGLPLSMVFDEAWKSGMVPGWVELKKEMDAAGVRESSRKIVSAVMESDLPREVKERVSKEFA